LPYLFFVAKNFLNYFNFEQIRKKLEPDDKELYSFLPKKLSTSSQKYESGIRDPKKTIPDPGSKCQKRHTIPEPQHCNKADINTDDGRKKVTWYRNTPESLAGLSELTDCPFSRPCTPCRQEKIVRLITNKTPSLTVYKCKRPNTDNESKTSKY
jgi:hypothetical protein